MKRTTSSNAPEDKPVFVDPSGRRRRALRISVTMLAAGVLAYLTLLVVALAGGPVNPAALLPLPADTTQPAASSPPPADTTQPAASSTQASLSALTTTAKHVLDGTRADEAAGAPSDAASSATPPIAVTTTGSPNTATATSRPGNTSPGPRTDVPGASNRPTERKG